MKCLDLTLPSPAENLACDEALLDWCESGSAGTPRPANGPSGFEQLAGLETGDTADLEVCVTRQVAGTPRPARERPGGILRFWEPTQHFVVVGYANQAAREVDLEACRKLQIPVLRRCSGGGAVLQGPGCLNYSLILKIEGPLQGITETNCFVMKRNAAALNPLQADTISVQGYTDLSFGNQKISGNSQRRRRQFLLFHGTFLMDFDAELMEKVLRHPSKEPDYRQKRGHQEFLARLKLPPSEIKSALREAWGAQEPLKQWPEERVRELALGKYSRLDWNRVTP